MKRINRLKNATTRHEFAEVLGVDVRFLTYVLYILKPSTQYSSFKIPKKSGGERTILAPSERLKRLQSLLSNLLQDCVQDLSDSKTSISTLSHGFVRKHSILTNASVHRHKKNVANIDLKDFFDCFNFGRVRGFFIKNNEFQLHPVVATIIAQIACYENKLPQGSPCSPVISNLIAHALDIRLASLASANSCVYSRYADDITFSTREKVFPVRLLKASDGEGYVYGKRLKSEIRRAGFELNENKTRVQYKDSRQDVTGLVVNSKLSVRKEYWRTVRAQCHSLFKSGEFFYKVDTGLVPGTIQELEGKLNFIDQVDRYNRFRLENKGCNQQQMNSREKVFSRFLFYKNFYANCLPTILTEGKTDVTYLKTAISRLAVDYPKLATARTKDEPYRLLVSLFKYTKRTKFFCKLGGGTAYLLSFIRDYEKNFKAFKRQNYTPRYPVIIVLDNDKGADGICSYMVQNYPDRIKERGVQVEDVRKVDFLYVNNNLYIVFVPLNNIDSKAKVDIESLFSSDTLAERIDGKKFSRDADKNSEYSKAIFAKKVILSNKHNIDFSGFKELLNRLTGCLEHYESIGFNGNI